MKKSKNLIKILVIMIIVINCFSLISFGTYSSTFREFDEECFEETSENSNLTNSGIIIAAVLNVLQVFGMLIFFIVICYAIIKIIIIKFSSKSINISEVDNDYKIKMKKEKNKIVIAIIIAIVLLVTSGIIQMNKKFAKPIIYIYPEEEKNVTVKIKKEDKLICTYPKYESDGWQVIASPDGTLKDIRTDRELYSLYWEGKNTTKPNYKEGFVIKGEDTIKFLEEKLEILGLNEKEAEEFIVYWLPQMEGNNYNYIRFENAEKLNEEMPLEITPEPDTLIRINMEFKPLLFPIKVEEQQLKQVERQGYTVVEWGGTKL